MGFFDFFTTEKHNGFFVQVVLMGLLFVYLGVRSALRKCYHAEAATQPVYFYTRRLITKIALNVLIIALYLAVTAVLFFEDEFWVPSLRWFAPIPLAATTLESNLLLFQYSHRLSSRFSLHGFVWIALTTLAALSTLIYFIMHHDPWEQTANLIFNFSQIAVFACRSAVQLSFPQDQEQVGSVLEQGLLSHHRALTVGTVSGVGVDIYGSSTQVEEKTQRAKSIFSERSNKKSSIGINVTVNSAKKVGGEYTFQLLVNYRGKMHKVSKTFVKFQELDHILRDHVDHAPAKYTELANCGPLNEATVSKTIRQLQSYIDNVLFCFDPLPDAVKNFLQIIEDSPIKRIHTQDFEISPNKKVGTAHGTRTPNSAGSRTPDHPRSSHGDDQDPEELKSSELAFVSHRRIMATKTALLKPDSDFCPYISVKLIDARVPSSSNHYEYTFNLSLSDNYEESWLITKRYREFRQLYDELKESKLKPPKLPPSRMMNSPQVVEERKEGLTLFLEIILNEEHFLRCQEVAQFVGLPAHTQNLFTEKSDIYDFSRWWVRVVDNKVRILSDNTTITEFVIVVHRENLEETDRSEQERSSDSQTYKLYKRMMDFERLYSALSDRYGKDVLPQLPPKFNAFFSQTSVESRMKGLEKFLNSLFTLPDIGDCFALRKFLNASTSRLRRGRGKAKYSQMHEEKYEATKEEEESLEDEDERIQSSLGSQTDKLETIQQLRHKFSEA